MKTSIELIVEELSFSELKERFLELYTNYEKLKEELFELKNTPFDNRLVDAGCENFNVEAIEKAFTMINLSNQIFDDNKNCR